MIPEKNPYNNWNGNGSTKTFDFDFYIEDETQLIVLHTNSKGIQSTLKYGTDYSINEFKNENGSFITFPLENSTYQTLGEDEVISLILTLPISQENEYGKSSYLDLKAIEYSLDYLTRICQIINRQMERAAKIPEGSKVVDVTFPYPEANNVIQWDDKGEKLINYNIDGKISNFENTTKQDIQNFKQEVNSTIGTFESSTNENIDQFKNDIHSQLTEFESSTNDNIQSLTDDVNSKITTFEESTNDSIQTFTDDMTSKMSDFEGSVEERIEQVTEAAKKINELDTAIEETKQASANATSAAQTAQQAAEEAIGATVNKADKSYVETELDSVNAKLEIKANKSYVDNELTSVNAKLDTKANVDLSNLSEKGEARFPIKPYNAEETFGPSEWVMGVVDGEKGLYESLKPENLGNPLTDETSWKKVELSGGSGSSGNNLFDLVYKDHELTPEESEGLAKLGSYVYKTTDADRAGYPDFYNKCLEEYRAVENEIEKIYTSSNITTTGHINNRKGVLSGFSTSNFAVMQKPFAPEATDSWEMVFKIRIPDTLPQLGSIIGNSTNDDFQGLFIAVQTSKKIQVNLTSNGTSWDVISGGVSTKTLESNTWYYVRMKGTYLEDPDNPQSTYVLDVSKDKQIWEEFLRYSEKKPIHKATIPYAIGMDNITSSLKPFCGDIDLNESYIKIGDEIFWQGVKTVEITKNQNGHRFYDIKNINDIDKLYKETGVAWYYGIDESKERVYLPRNNYFFQNADVGEYIEAGLPEHEHTLTYNNHTRAYRTDGVVITTLGEGPYIAITDKVANYNVTDTVQPPAVGCAVYMVVGTTTTTRAQGEVTEVTSSENDTLPLFTGMYFDFKPNHISWLKASTQASGTMYKSAYNELVNVLNGTQTKYGMGLKVVDEKQKSPGIDYSEYWIVNQEEETFRTPLKISILNTEEIAGNENIGLYFKIGNAVEKLELLNAGEILEDCVLKSELLPAQTVIDTYINGESGYRIWSDGWCEQWFSVNATSNVWVTSIFLKEMRDMNYIATGACKIPDGTYPLSIAFKNYTTSTIDSSVHDDSSVNSGTWMVKIEGYLKEGTY